MKKYLLFIIASLSLVSCVTTKGKNREAGKPGQDATSTNKTTSVYNQKLADSLGADQYGMKAYYIAMLTTGKKKSRIKIKCLSS